MSHSAKSCSDLSYTVPPCLVPFCPFPLMSCLVPSHSVHSRPIKHFVSCYTLSCPTSSFCPVLSYHAVSCLVLSYTMWYWSSPPVHPPVPFFYFLSCCVLSCPIPTNPSLSSNVPVNHVIYFPALPFLHDHLFHVLSCPFLIYPVRSSSIIVYTFLSCKVISCHVLYACLHSPYTNQLTWKSINHLFFLWLKAANRIISKFYFIRGCDFVLKKPRIKISFSTLTSSSPCSDDSKCRRPSRMSFVKTFSTQFLSRISWIKSFTRVGISTHLPVVLAYFRCYIESILCPLLTFHLLLYFFYALTHFMTPFSSTLNHPDRFCML